MSADQTKSAQGLFSVEQANQAIADTVTNGVTDSHGADQADDGPGEMSKKGGTHARFL